MVDSTAILHVDDDPSFGELTKTVLEQEDDRFSVETATSAEEGLESIADRQPDCVVSDYNMPGMDGLEFLEAVREEYPDLPFILFTGKGSEEVASDAISAGATDYLQKQSGTDHYSLLANRILNAVTQYRAENRLTETRKEYTTIFENAQNALLLVDIEDDGFRYQQCNPKASELIGRDRSEIVGEPPREALGPENAAKVVKAYRRCLQQREAVAYTVTLDLPVGRVVRDCEATPVVSEGEIERLVVEFQDITDQRERQRDLEKVQTLFEHAQDSLLLVNVGDEFTIERVNPAYEDATGVSASEVQGRTLEQVLGEDQASGIEARYRECVERREPLQYTVQLQFGSEPSHWETRIAPVVIEDTVEYIAVSTRNVTEKKERRQELEEYETVIESLTDAVYVLDEDGRFTYVNDEFVELVGYDRETILGSMPSLIKDEKAVDRAEKELRRLLSSDGPETVTFEVTVQPRDGDPIVCEDHMGVLPYEGNQFDGSVGMLRDITSRKERERQVRRERERYITLFETLPNPVLHARIEDGDPVVETVNPVFEDTFGYDAETIRDEPIQDYILPDGQADAAHRLNRQVLTEGDVQTEVQRETTEGVRTFRLNVSTRNTGAEYPEGYAVYTDITDRKQMERALEQERDLVTGIVETVPVGISVHEPDGSISFVNDQLESITGRALEDLEGNPYDDSQYDLVDRHGEPLGSGETPFDHVVSRETAIHKQVVGTRRPSGERVWLSVSGVPQYNDNGELERTVFAFEDITEQRELETELSEIFGRISDAFFALDEEFRFTHVNDRAEELLEASEEELRGETPWKVYQDMQKGDEIWDSFRAAIDSQDPQSLEFYSPEENWYDVTVYPSENGVSVYFRDVTNRKKREQELVRTRDLLTNMEELADAGAWAYDSETDTLTITDGTRRLYGLDPGEDLTLDAVLGAVHSEDRDGLAARLTDCLETGEPYEIDVRVTTSDGTQRWLTAKGERVSGSDGGGVIRGYIRDITAQKTRERELEWVKSQYQTLIESYPDGAMFLYDTDFRVVRAGGTELSEVGLSLEEIEGTTPQDRYPPEIAGELVSNIENALAGETNTFEQEYQGEHYRIRTAPVQTGEKEETHAMAVSQNITDRVADRQELERQNELFAKAQDIADIGAWAHDTESGTLTWTDQVYEMHGVSKEFDPSVDDVAQFYHPDDRPKLREAVNQAVTAGEPYDLEVRMTATDDGTRWIRTVADPQISNGDVVRVRGTVHDITDRIEREQELERTTRRLGEFASVLSHDLRNPLNMASGRLDLAREECDSEHLAEIEHSHDRMRELIKDLLTLAREGEEVGEVGSVDLTELIESCWRTVDTQEATLNVDTPGVIRADRSRLKQVLENLIRNAVEHGGDGVTVSVGAMDGGFYVADTGPGIPETEREEIFEAGYSTTADGTGFGLKIAEQIAEAHGWEITVTESEQGGTRFEFTGVEFVD